MYISEGSSIPWASPMVCACLIINACKEYQLHDKLVRAKGNRLMDEYVEDSPKQMDTHKAKLQSVSSVHITHDRRYREHIPVDADA